MFSTKKSSQQWSVKCIWDLPPAGSQTIGNRYWEKWSILCLPSLPTATSRTALFRESSGKSWSIRVLLEARTFVLLIFWKFWEFSADCVSWKNNCELINPLAWTTLFPIWNEKNSFTRRVEFIRCFLIQEWSHQSRVCFVYLRCIWCPAKTWGDLLFVWLFIEIISCTAINRVYAYMLTELFCKINSYYVFILKLLLI